MASHPSLPPNEPIGHEEGDLRVGAVLWFGVGLAVVLLAVVIATARLFSLFAMEEERRKRSDLPLAGDVQTQSARLPPAPRLEGIEEPGRAGHKGVGQIPFIVSTPRDLSRAIHWVDEEREFAAIPIEDPRNPRYAREFFERFLEAENPKVREGHTWLDASDALPSDANSGRPPYEREP
jgi:hypothetical protein